MVRGVFPHWPTYLGLATGLIGIVSESLRPLLGPAYIVYGLLLFVWLVAVGWELLHLAREAAPNRG